jgi:phage/plasmid-associated DNA primase
LVIFREPAEKSKFENSIIKTLTGGGRFSARSLYDNNTEKILHNTTFVECNNKPKFAEEPKVADLERLIDIYYRSTFTGDPNLIDESNRVYKQDPSLKNANFQQQHKCALLKIIFE